jgi:hypothetical protein
MSEQEYSLLKQRVHFCSERERSKVQLQASRLLGSVYVLQLRSGIINQAALCREHELSPQLLLQWKQTFQQNAATAFQTNEQNSAETARIAT